MKSNHQKWTYDTSIKATEYYYYDIHTTYKKQKLENNTHLLKRLKCTKFVPNSLAWKIWQRSKAVAYKLEIIEH